MNACGEKWKLPLLQRKQWRILRLNCHLTWPIFKICNKYIILHPIFVRLITLVGLFVWKNNPFEAWLQPVNIFTWERLFASRLNNITSHIKFDVAPYILSQRFRSRQGRTHWLAGPGYSLTQFFIYCLKSFFYLPYIALNLLLFWFSFDKFISGSTPELVENIVLFFWQFI